MAKPKILLLDPDVKNRSILEISLKKSGFTVTCGESATEAVDVVGTFAPDLIISEIGLEDRDGFWLVEQLQKDDSQQIPVIFLTKQKRVEDKIKGLELGVEDYLVKPIYLREVVARVKLLVEKKKGAAREEEEAPKDVAGNLFQGALEDMGVVDIMQTMEFGSKTAIVHLSHPSRDAQLFVQDGRVVHAVAGSLVGERAMYKVMQWVEGNFKIDFRKSLQVQPTITTSTQGLIMEGVRRIDEIERLKEQLPPFNARLVIDSAVILEEHPDRFPAKIENILAEFDGTNDVETVVESLPYDDLESLEVISKLYFQGFLVEAPDLVEEVAEEEPAASSKSESSMLATGGVLDLDALDLGDSTSVENIKRKARGGVSQEDSQSEKSRSSRNAPVFDSLPGFDLAPPSERVVKVSQKERIAASARAKSTGSQSSTKPKPSAFRAAAESEAPTTLAPPIITAGTSTAPSVSNQGSSILQAPVEEKKEPPKQDTPVQPKKPAKEEASPAAKKADEAKQIGKIQPRKPRPAVEKPVPPRRDPDEIAVVGNVVQVAVPKEVPPLQPAASAPPQADTERKSRGPLVAVLLLLLVGVSLAGGWFLTREQQKSPEEWLVLAQQELDNRKFDAAMAHVRRALELSPSNLDARILAGDIEVERRNTQEAINLYAHVVASDPSRYAVRYRYALLLFEQQDDDSADRALNVTRNLLIDISPLRDRSLYVKTLVLQTEVLLFLKRPDNARIALDKLDAQDPVNAQIPRLRALLQRLEESEKKAKAREAEELKPATTIQPPTAAARTATKNKPAQKARTTTKAKTEPVKAAASKPAASTKQREAREKREKAEALHRKGLDLYRKGYLKNSERAFVAALELVPEQVDVLIDLGRVYSELGQDRTALKYFLRAAQINSRNPRVYINLGSIYMLMGETQDAIRAYKTYVKLMPAGSSEVQEVKQILNKLGAR